MSDASPEPDHAASGFSPRGFLENPVNQRWLAVTGLLSLALVSGGYLLGNGLVRAKEADRAVTVRGLAERDVTADLATWTLSFASSAPDLAGAQAEAARNLATIKSFFHDAGFADGDLQPTGVNVNQFTDNGVTKFTVTQRMALRTHDIAKAQAAARRQFELVEHGVALEEGSGIEFSFTKLGSIKPAMIAEATRDARASAEQFAKDSNTSVGAIRDATQGYFSVMDRDATSGDDSGGGNGGAIATPFKKVRVVTTVRFALD